jgi:hypothetical protein
MPPTSQVLAGAATVIVDMSLNVSIFVAQFSGVPGLAPALGVLLAISRACDQIQSNEFVFF